jgi:hypothetical protein
MLLRTLLAAVVICVSARADFSYEQTSRVSGGAMAGMMRMAGAFSKSAREPMRTTVMVQGDRMAMLSQDRINIIDLAAETMTDVDLKKKTYAVITFADMAKAMERMAEKMGQRKDNAEVQFRADVKPTGQTRVISGLDTKQTIVTLAVEGNDKAGNKGAMDLTMDMWMAPSIPGYEEVRNFYARMAQKMPFNPAASGMAGQMMAQHSKGMSELVKEMSKLDGVPVLQITRIGGSGAPPSEGQAGAAQSQSAPAASADSEQSTGVGRAGRIAAGLGGFGGFGRKKKQAEPAQEQPQQASSSSAGPEALMELTTELSGFSSSPVDGSKFQTPAGFKQVSHDMEKLLK